MSLVDEIQRNENMLSIKFENPLHVKKIKIETILFVLF